MSFDRSDVEGVCAYMNGGMPDNVLYMVHMLAPLPEADSAMLVDITETHAHFDAVVDGVTRRVELAWPLTVNNREDMKTQLFALFDAAMRADS